MIVRHKSDVLRFLADALLLDEPQIREVIRLTGGPTDPWRTAGRAQSNVGASAAAYSWLETAVRNNFYTQYNRSFLQLRERSRFHSAIDAATLGLVQGRRLDRATLNDILAPFRAVGILFPGDEGYE